MMLGIPIFAGVPSINKKAMPKKNKLFPMSKVAPKRDESEEMDSVKFSKKESFGSRRAFDILMEAQYYWSHMDRFRRDRERNKNYNYGKQWEDKVCVNGKTMTEEEYIKSQGNIPLKNNLIRRLVRNVLGVYRSQMKEPTCTARDRDEQRASETMSTILQYNNQLNKMGELNARSMEELLISGLVVHRKSFGWLNGKQDCWTESVQPYNFFIDNNMRDFRGWDVSFLGEIHDVSFGSLAHEFAKNSDDYKRLKRIYSYASNRSYLSTYAESFGYSRLSNYDFLLTNDPGRCRVIEVWRKEQKPRYRCHDYQTGEIFKIEIEDYEEMVEKVNNERKRMASDYGMPEEEVPLITAEWFIDDYWYFYYLTPFGDILREGETPYDHGSHPYVFKAYPFIDGEIHSFVNDVIDQQRYVNRLVTMYDWIMRASAKGVLLMPEDCLPDGVSMDDIAESWAEFNGVIVYKPSASRQVPTQVANNSTNIGITELLNLQLKFFEDISGVNGALQGKPGFSGQSASMYNQQVQNSTMSLLDLMESFSDFVIDGAYKTVKNIQQYYDPKKIREIVGDNGEYAEYDPQKILNIEFDISITESTTSPAYRQMANEWLMQLWQAQAISVKQLLEFGDFPFADELLQSIESQEEQVENGQIPNGVSPQIMQQAQQGANMNAVNMLYDKMRQ